MTPNIDVKMDLTSKSRYLAGGNLTNTPSSIAYVSVFSFDIMRLAFLIIAFHNLYILAGDIKNAI